MQQFLRQDSKATQRQNTHKLARVETDIEFDSSDALVYTSDHFFCHSAYYQCLEIYIRHVVDLLNGINVVHIETIAELVYPRRDLLLE